jgi:hypothetical protein
VDQTIKFWKVPEGQLLLTVLATANIFDIQFDRDGSTIGMAFSGGSVYVVQTSGLFLHQE